MEERKLNFAEQAVQVLTLGELERSYHENLPTMRTSRFALMRRMNW